MATGFAVKGDIQIGRTAYFGRRSVQGLNSAVITGAETFTKDSAYWQRLSAAAGQDANLPDATTLENGWQIVVEASGASTITVKDADGGTEKAVESGRAYCFTCLDNSSSAGTWHVNHLEEHDQLPSDRYTETFDATTDWGTASGGYYTITITQATHGRGTSPIVQFYEESGTDYIRVEVDEVKFASNGDLSFRVTEAPDGRFAGKAVMV